MLYLTVPQLYHLTCCNFLQAYIRVPLPQLKSNTRPDGLQIPLASTWCEAMIDSYLQYDRWAQAQRDAVDSKEAPFAPY